MPTITQPDETKTTDGTGNQTLLFAKVVPQNNNCHCARTAEQKSATNN